MNYNNLAQKTNFIAGSDQFKNLPFFITNINIPGLNINHTDIGGRHSTPLKITGNTIEYNSLSFEMLIDEDFQIYQELIAVLNKNVSVNTGNFADFTFDFFVELSNSKGNKILKLNFTDCRISSIGDISLDVQDDGTEYTLSVELEYTKYEIENIKRYDLIGNNPIIIETNLDTQSVFSESFETLDDWTLWGFPVPVLTSDDGATNTLGFDSNGSGSYESGAVLNTTEIDVTKPFEFIFRVKQPLGADSNESYYLDFGITEGIGIESTSNGRTGSTVMGVTLNGGTLNDSIKNIVYSIKDNTDDVKSNFTNNGQYNEYKFSYTTDGTNANYKIYKNGELESSATESMSTHDFFYLYIQGKSESGIQIVDTIIGEYGSQQLNINSFTVGGLDSNNRNFLIDNID
jgi:hypothetical protein